MENMIKKALAGRRIAILKKALRAAQSNEPLQVHAPSFAVQDLPQHQFLQKISLSEERVSRLKAQ